MSLLEAECAGVYQIALAGCKVCLAAWQPAVTLLGRAVTEPAAEMEVEQLRVAVACADSVISVPFKTVCRNARLEVFAARAFQIGGVVGFYYGTLMYHYLSSRRLTRKVLGEGVLKKDLARMLEYA